MQNFFQKPENALKRAEELVAVDKKEDALKVLGDSLTHRKFKNQWTTTIEQIVMRHIELCVDMRKIKLVKEGLYQYRGICQQASIQSLEQAILHVRDLAEAKVAEAQKLVSENEAKIDDLDTMESPEAVLLGAVQADVKRNTDRDVNNWFRFLWEMYKTIMDLLRNNCRMEDCYHETARKAFDFCLNNGRQMEFKRLCETLRNHWSQMSKGLSNNPNAVNLNNPETINRMMETRFKQLSVACGLDLWREAFASIDDIYLLMQKRRPKPQMLARYYEGLAHIFWTSNSYIFHAFAWLKYFVHSLQRKSFEDEKQQIANYVVLAILSIPFGRNTESMGGDFDVDNMKEKHKRMATLLGSNSVPTRDSLKADLKAKGILQTASPVIQNLYKMVECDFVPLSVCTDAKPVLDEIAQDDKMSMYAQSLRRLIFTRFVTQLSKVYSSVTIKAFTDMCSIVSFNDAEKWIVLTNKSDHLDWEPIRARIDHAKQAIWFGTDNFVSTNLRHQLQSLGSVLVDCTNRMYPEVAKAQADQIKSELFDTIHERLKEEQRETSQRKRLIEKRKEHEENRVLQEDRKLRVQQEKDEKIREEQDRVRQETARIEREKERAAKAKKEQEVQKSLELVAQMKAQSKKDLDLKVGGKKLAQMDQADLAAINTTDIEKASLDALKKEKHEKIKWWKSEFRRIDYLARALREEEDEPLKAWAEKATLADVERNKSRVQEAREKAKKEHEEKLALKQQLSGVQDPFNKWVDSVLDERRALYEEAIAEVREQQIQELRDAKVQRAMDRRDRAVAQENERMEREKREKEQEERTRREDEDRERARQEQESKRAEMRKKDEEHQDMLRRQEEKQRAREREIDEKRGGGGDHRRQDSRGGRDERRGSEDRDRQAAPAPAWRRQREDGPPRGAPETFPGGDRPSWRANRGDEGGRSGAPDSFPGSSWRSNAGKGASKGGDERPAPGWRSNRGGAPDEFPGRSSGGDERPAPAWRANRGGAPDEFPRRGGAPDDFPSRGGDGPAWRAGGARREEPRRENSGGGDNWRSRAPPTAEREDRPASWKKSGSALSGRDEPPAPKSAWGAKPAAAAPAKEQPKREDSSVASAAEEDDGFTTVSKRRR